MKKKLFSCILLAVFACVALFGLAACDNGSGYDDSALVDRIEALEDQIAQQGETIENQQDTIDEQSQTIENQAAAITALQTSVTELQTAKTNLEEQIASLEDDNTANKTEITTLKTKVEALEAANAKFQQQIDALDTSSVTFAEDLAELTSNYNSLTDSVQNATHIERVVVTKENIETNPLIKDVRIYSTISSKTGTVSLTTAIHYNVTFFPYHLAVCKVNLTYEENIYDYSVPIVKENADESGNVSGSYTTDIKPTDISAVTVDWIEIVLYKLT